MGKNAAFYILGGAAFIGGLVWLDRMAKAQPPPGGYGYYDPTLAEDEFGLAIIVPAQQCISLYGNRYDWDAIQWLRFQWGDGTTRSVTSYEAPDVYTRYLMPPGNKFTFPLVPHEGYFRMRIYATACHTGYLTSVWFIPQSQFRYTFDADSGVLT